jgi:hypothetical protein
MSDAAKIEKMWVTVAEASEITGYSRDRIKKIAFRNWNLPEAEREIDLRKESHNYLIYLPSLIKYALTPRRGPQPKRKHPST